MKLLADRIHDPITVMSSDVRPAGCVGSHQPPAPREINTVEHQQLLAESLPSFSLSILPSFHPSFQSPTTHDPQTHRAIPSPSRTGHCFNQSEGKAPGSCFWGLIEGSSLNSPTWSKWLHGVWRCDGGDGGRLVPRWPSLRPCGSVKQGFTDSTLGLSGHRRSV